VELIVSVAECRGQALSFGRSAWASFNPSPALLRNQPSGHEVAENVSLETQSSRDRQVHTGLGLTLVRLYTCCT